MSNRKKKKAPKRVTLGTVILVIFSVISAVLVAIALTATDETPSIETVLVKGDAEQRPNDSQAGQSDAVVLDISFDITAKGSDIYILGLSTGFDIDGIDETSSANEVPLKGVLSMATTADEIDNEIFLIKKGTTANFQLTAFMTIEEASFESISLYIEPIRWTHELGGDIRIHDVGRELIARYKRLNGTST